MHIQSTFLPLTSQRRANSTRQIDLNQSPAYVDLFNMKRMRTLSKKQELGGFMKYERSDENVESM